MATIATLMVKLGLDAAEFTNGLGKAQGQLQSAGKKMSNVGKSLTAGVTLPIVGLGVAALNSAADFEQSMNILRQVSGATATEVEALSDAALQLGADSVFSAGEVAKAQLELAKAGMTVNQVMDATAGVVSLAAAADVSLANAASITANALNAFGLEASEAGRVSDLLAAAANASSADITDLAAGLQQGGFAFNAAGQKIDDLAASIAILTNVGLTGSDAGTALKNAFMRIMAPTKEASTLMASLGIDLFDAQGNMLPMIQIIDVLNGAMAGMTQEQRLLSLETMFMSDGMKAFIPLLDQGSEGFGKMLESVNKTGAATDTANARMSGLAGALDYFKGTLDSVLIQGGTPWLEMLGNLVRGAADLIAKFGNLPAPVQKGIVVFLAIVAVVGPLIVIIGTLVSSVGAIVGAFAAVPAIVATVGAVLAALTGPIGLVVLAVAGLALAYKTNFLGIRDATDAAVGWIGGQLNNLRGFWSSHSDQVKAIAGNQWSSLKAMYEIQWELLRGISTAGMQFISGDWEGGMETLHTMVGNIWGRIRTIFQNQLDNIKQLFTFFGWGELGENIARGIGQGITAGLRWIRDAATNAAQSALESAQAWLGINSPSTVAADEIGEPFGQGIGVGAGRALDDITGSLGTRLDALMGGLQPSPGFAGAGVAPGGMNVQITQYFYGAADAATVEGASRNGVVSALRQVGVR